jgi:hypothetical protein
VAAVRVVAVARAGKGGGEVSMALKQLHIGKGVVEPTQLASLFVLGC